ncbi:class II aaRS and biotin synthetase [Nemania sp. FL0916]|nr:class II aaRS and biotin synthetase [Nemania sp. FL0916]
MTFSLRNAQQCRISLYRQIRVPRRRYSNNVSSVGINESHITGRFSRLSRFWLATGGIAKAKHEDGYAKLIRGGYLRQSHAGIFHMLPLGERVQNKLEKLIDKHMSSLGASKVSLSSLSSQALWKQTNRLEGYGQELFRLTDRKDVPYILAPTHEEEITTLVAKKIQSYKQLPLRLYQISRKYRDEIRPRHGLLRSKEFVMKDLYTFDHSLRLALKTYEEARVSYNQLFNELKLPYLVAEASSGDIGGDLSHEYHLPSPIGEDIVITCTECDYVANEELAIARHHPPPDGFSTEGTNTLSSGTAQVWRGISKDRNMLVNVWYPAPYTNTDINAHVLKSIIPDLDSSIKDVLPLWESTIESSAATSQRPQLLNIVDYRLGQRFVDSLNDTPNQFPILPRPSSIELSQLDQHYIASKNGEPFNTIRIHDGDHCSRCTSGKLKVHKTIELGHTFHLGTKYSDALHAHVQIPSSLIEEGHVVSAEPNREVGVSMQMGCHGIGVSRIIGAVAEHLADESGLNWPRAIAPFEVVVISDKHMEDATAISESLTRSSDAFPPLDLILDDRDESFGWKLKDADLVGYPVLLILGRQWKSDRLCEVQCRWLKSVEAVPVDKLREHISNLLARL